jgi:uncharacterized repeat protein (TIGR02543 family)
MENLFNYRCLLLVMVTVSLGISSETPLSAYAANAADKSNAIWDEEFEGIGSAYITYRSYLDFYIYDYDTKAFLGIIKMDKKTGGSSIDGEYVVKYNGKDLITFRNDGNYCFLAMGDEKTFFTDFFQFLFNNSNSSIRGHENYLVEGHSTIKVYARKNSVGPYNGSGWISLEECQAAEWTVDTSTKTGGKASDGSLLYGNKTLNAAQQNNIRRLFENTWKMVFTPEGSTCTITYNANGGKMDGATLKDDTFVAYHGVCINDIPTRSGYYFWGWSETKYEAGKGPSDYFDMYHAGDSLGDIWKRTTLYAVWGKTPFGGETPVAHNHNWRRSQRSSGRCCPDCGEPLYFWGETCTTCGEYRVGDDIPHTCPDSRLIYISGECTTCNMSGPNEGNVERTGNTQVVLGIGDTGLKYFGHTFVGWNTERDAKGQWYKKGDIYSFGKSGQTKYLYAIWKPNTYTVTFDYNGEGLLNSASMVKGVTSKRVSYDDLMTDLPEPYLTGFTFLGWYSDVKEVVVNEYQRYGIAFDSTFLAQWGGHSISVVTDPAFPDGAVNQKVPALYTLYGHTFDMDYGTRYSAWIPVSLYPSCDGYEFTGWTYAGQKINNDTICTYDGDHVLKGSWKFKDVKLTLDPRQGHFENAEDGATREETRKYNDVLTGVKKLPIPVREGYQFGGWYTERDGKGTKVENEDKLLIGNDSTLYAKWIARKSYVTFDYNENWKYAAKDLVGNNVTDMIVTFDEMTYLPTPERYGYTFEGWSAKRKFYPEFNAYNGDEDDIISSEGICTIKENTVLYAVWKALTVKVNYDFNYDYTETIPLP